MKLLAPYIFVFFYLVAMVRPVLPVLEYVFDQEYIADFFCINQDRPEMNCEGKCYLIQMLEEQNENKEQDLPRTAMEEYPIGFVIFLEIEWNSAVDEKCADIEYYSNLYYLIPSFTSFRPPSYTS